MKPNTSKNKSAVDLSKREEQDVEGQVANRAPVVFEIVRREGEEELSRPWVSLWWSGVAAGISMGFSVLAEAFLHIFLPASPVSMLIERLGYSVGFLIVIAARQQLFTENTLTAVVPLLANFDRENTRNFSKLWGVVLLANLVGTALFAAFIYYSPGFPSEVQSAIHGISVRPFALTWLEIGSRAIVAGFLIASLVWILANIETSRFVMIVVVTYVIALGGFAHVIAGSVETMYLVFDGTIGIGTALGQFYLPALIGNVVGGSALFTMLTYGQVHQEIG